MDWSEERVTVLRELWTTGFSARQIADRLGEGCTRNAVIGKANRLGLSQPTRSSLTRRQKQRERQLQREQIPVRPARLPDSSPPPQPVSPGATILALTTSTCRWPLGDPTSPDFRFCGANAKPGQPYCEAHARMAYQPASSLKDSRKRSA
ncbi:MAG: GcrA cell cycle regulator [Alphaproteobacteria bacterium]|nr:GcrA cell cycle regulator [Alphaproteobacteria bacterium]